MYYSSEQGQGKNTETLQIQFKIRPFSFHALCPHTNLFSPKTYKVSLVNLLTKEQYESLILFLCYHFLSSSLYSLFFFYSQSTQACLVFRVSVSRHSEKEDGPMLTDCISLPFSFQSTFSQNAHITDTSLCVFFTVFLLLHYPTPIPSYLST